MTPNRRELHSSQLVTLEFLHQMGVGATEKEIAAQFGISVSAANERMLRLLGRGLVEKRGRLWFPTEAAKETGDA